MYIIHAPEKKFGKLPTNTPLLTDEVKFTNNVAYCTKYFWKKHHLLQGCRDVTPNWMRRLRKNRELFRILFISTGGIGDVLWTMPFIKAIKKKHPRARVYVATEERNMPLFLGVPYVDLCVKNEYWNLQNLVRTANEVYDFGGIATMLQKEMKMDPVDATFLDGELPKPKDKKECRPMIVVTADEGKRTQGILRRYKVDLKTDKLVILALESSTPNRNWPYSYTRELTQRLIADGLKVLWLSQNKDFGDTYFYNCNCGYEFTIMSKTLPEKMIWKCPACKAQNALDEIKHPDGVINLAGQTDLRQAITLCALSDIVVGPNSGLMVIATALETPTLGLFGAFDPKIRTKYYDRFSYIWGRTSCSPCKEHWTECKLGHPAPCMRVITVDMVYDSIKEMLKKYPRSNLERIPIE